MAATSTTGPEPEPWTTYRDKERRLEVSYPNDWYRSEEPLTPYLGDPKEILSLGSYPLRPGGDRCAHHPVNALFTDIRLPGALDGWQLAEQARKLHPVLPVIYATGYSEETPRVVTGGVFLRKPYVPSTVMAALDRLLAR